MTEQTNKPGKGRLIAGIIFKYLGRLLVLALTAIVGAALLLYLMLSHACHGNSPAARELFATTVLETGALKWTAKLVLTEEEIEEILSNNTMAEIDTTIDSSLISVPSKAGESETAEDNAEEEFDINGIEIVKISGRTFDATMMIINDPSRVYCATTYPTWEKMDLGEIVEEHGALGGVNGGLYDQVDYVPYNLAVSQGELVYNGGCYEGLYIIGFDEDNILRIIPTGNGSSNKMKQLVEENHIRDAVAFHDVQSATNANFVPLIINGVPRETSGLGSGANPRTAIGQRADGAVLLLVTDGRGANGHLGATAGDLIDIMLEYGAVNAANIDGGSSSAMYYDGEYLMTSTTLIYANASYDIPTAFVIERRDENGG